MTLGNKVNKKIRNKRILNLFALTKAGMMETIRFRVGLVSMFFGNLIYIIIMYSLWKAIYLSAEGGVVNGMTFQDTLLSICLITTLHTGMQVNLVEKLTIMIRTGEIIVYLIKPVGFPIYMFFMASGDLLAQFIFVIFPSLAIVTVITWGKIHLGIQLLLFIISILLGLIMNYCFNLCVSIVCIYTESGWGINLLKELMMSLFSGAIIPVVFFTQKLKIVANCLPFQAMYNIPVRILLSEELDIKIIGRLLGIQLLWCVVLVIIFNLLWMKGKKNIIVNGG